MAIVTEGLSFSFSIHIWVSVYQLAQVKGEVISKAS